MKRNSGKFGKLVRYYKATRPSYPPMVIRDIYAQIKAPSPLILDLGCGTGISTRQLAVGKGSIIGCDVDADMLAHASAGKYKNIKYVKGDAEELPFAQRTFDAVTMFTSFHWFTTKKAIAEIRRVLKPKGIACIVQPNYKSSFRRDLRKIINQALKLGIKPRYSSKKFPKFLSENKFRITKTKVYKMTNKYTLSEFIQLLQSISTWAYVPISQRKNMIRLVRAYYSRALKNGKINDPVVLHLICAKSKS